MHKLRCVFIYIIYMNVLGVNIIVFLHLFFFSRSRFLTPQELTVLINYLQDKRDRLVRGSTDSHLGEFVLKQRVYVLIRSCVSKESKTSVREMIFFFFILNFFLSSAFYNKTFFLT